MAAWVLVLLLPGLLLLVAAAAQVSVTIQFLQERQLLAVALLALEPILPAVAAVVMVEVPAAPASSS
jgi:hypothetical protein